MVDGRMRYKGRGEESGGFAPVFKRRADETRNNKIELRHVVITLLSAQRCARSGASPRLNGAQKTLEISWSDCASG